MNKAHIDTIGASRGSFKSYATGFILSIVLTVIAFALVLSGGFSRSAVLFGIFFFHIRSSIDSLDVDMLNRLSEVDK